jgi:hypothetical protein
MTNLPITNTLKLLPKVIAVPPYTPHQSSLSSSLTRLTIITNQAATNAVPFLPLSSANLPAFREAIRPPKVKMEVRTPKSKVVMGMQVGRPYSPTTPLL